MLLFSISRPEERTNMLHSRGGRLLASALRQLRGTHFLARLQRFSLVCWEKCVVYFLSLNVPVSSSEAERSFSALGSLKALLCLIRTQKWQNHVAVCHIHPDKLDILDKKAVCKQYISSSQTSTGVYFFQLKTC